MHKDAQRADCLGLHWAATTGNVGLIKFALDHGADVNSVANGYSPLQLACTSDTNITSVQYLIDRGAEVNSQRWPRKYSLDKSKAVAGATGSTALHIACANGCVRTVDLLLRNGAISDVKDKYGTTAVDLAISKQNTDILRLLQISRKRSASFSAPLQAPNLAMERSRRRPSLPIVATHQKPLPTLPEERHTLFNGQPENSQKKPQQHPSFQPQSSAIPISPSGTSPLSPTPELSYSNSSEDSDPQPASHRYRLAGSLDCDPQDWYSYGVLHPYHDDNYLASLERRACGMTLESICLRGQERDEWIKDEELIKTIRPVETSQKRSWWGSVNRQKSIDSVRPSLEFKPDFTTLPLGNGPTATKKKDILSRWLPWIFRKRKNS
ncbi:ankyrin repeat-containing domain protein [Phycomyces nitens]|nr:ankyrin repeat-containing domain protein [Phycomyces nitens]